MYYVYIITNKVNTVLYIGVTNNLIKRIYQHKNKMVDGFSKTYNLNKLVYFESCNDIKIVIEREKQLKKISRKKKELLIESLNKDWQDLCDNLV